MWSPDNTIIDIHPLEWMKSQDSTKLKIISWQETH
jgi:hypothetical protein